jgi:hypothetical protein
MSPDRIAKPKPEAKTCDARFNGECGDLATRLSPFSALKRRRKNK